MRPSAWLWTLLLTGCLATGTSPAAAAGTPAEPVDDTAHAVCVAHNRFGLRLFQEICSADSGSNVFISPASAAVALAMLYNGAGGITRTEMAAALKLGSLSLGAVNEANAALLAALNRSDSSVQLAVANSIWYRNAFSVRPDFLDCTRRYYQSEVAALDFDDAGAPGIINGWVEQRTRGKISRIIDRIDSDDILFLLNAVYFKGLWTHPFSKELTADRAFHCLDGTSMEVPMMQQTESFGYLETEKFQAVQLPYGSGSSSLLLILPAAELGLRKLVGSVTPDSLAGWQNRLEHRDVHIVMPRFKLRNDRLLNDPLMALGMKSAFDPQLADLTGLWEPADPMGRSLFVSFVRQKTFVDVNEEGTEAAAVTEIGIKATSMPPPPVEMLVDRPFFCALVDDATGLILFMGAIVDPGESGSSD